MQWAATSLSVAAIIAPTLRSEAEAGAEAIKIRAGNTIGGRVASR